MIPDQLKLIVTDYQIPGPHMLVAAETHQTLAEVNADAGVDYKALYPDPETQAQAVERLRDWIKFMFGLELPDPLTREDFDKLYNTPLTR